MTWIDMPATPPPPPMMYLTTTPEDTRAEVILARLIQEAAHREDGVKLKFNGRGEVSLHVTSSCYTVLLPRDLDFEGLVDELYDKVCTVLGRALR